MYAFVGPQNPPPHRIALQLPPQGAVTPPAPGFWGVLLGLAVVGLGVYGIAELLAPAPARTKRRRPNFEPLETWKKEYVSDRDGWRCVYCGRRVYRSTRHIDHRVSRRNLGTNHLNNLSLSCSTCNLQKGALNARQFMGTF